MNNDICSECVDSTNNYISHGVCVAKNFYWDKEFLRVIDTNNTFSKFPKCIKANNDKC